MSDKHSIVISGHATSISLEDIFWKRLKDIARRDGVSLATLIAEIDSLRPPNAGGLSSALRVFILQDALRTAQARHS